jgi:hypothetical protein
MKPRKSNMKTRNNSRMNQRNNKSFLNDGTKCTDCEKVFDKCTCMAEIWL